jgi:hypothetical protein
MKKIIKHLLVIGLLTIFCSANTESTTINTLYTCTENRLVVKQEPGYIWSMIMLSTANINIYLNKSGIPGTKERMYHERKYMQKCYEELMESIASCNTVFNTQDYVCLLKGGCTLERLTFDADFDMQVKNHNLTALINLINTVEIPPIIPYDQFISLLKNSTQNIQLKADISILEDIATKLSQIDGSIHVYSNIRKSKLIIFKTQRFDLDLYLINDDFFNFTETIKIKDKDVLIRKDNLFKTFKEKLTAGRPKDFPDIIILLNKLTLTKNTKFNEEETKEIAKLIKYIEGNKTLLKTTGYTYFKNGYKYKFIITDNYLKKTQKKLKSISSK